MQIRLASGEHQGWIPCTQNKCSCSSSKKEKKKRKTTIFHTWSKRFV